MSSSNPSRPFLPFAVEVESVDFKFSSGHFVASRGFRERLHGHNYTVGVRLEGTRVNPDGYVLDFGDVKEVTKSCCRALNEYVLLPGRSDVLSFRGLKEGQGGSSTHEELQTSSSESDVPGVGAGGGRGGVSLQCPPVESVIEQSASAMEPKEEANANIKGAGLFRASDDNDSLWQQARAHSESKNVEILTEQGQYFSLPRADCKILPIVHTTAEELAEYLWTQIHQKMLKKLGPDRSLRIERGIEMMEVIVAERPIQRAIFRKEVP
ncbi:unnamed protein product [Amoebophrya sp. A25]|nr:unnamed protein product [Amoebophrya sp. A25]|eukprot:GSA25T00008185001.1